MAGEVEQEDAALIDAARAGDRAAYAELFTRHRGPAKRFAYSLVGDDIRADDLVSDAFIKVMVRLDDGAGPTGNFRGYLFSTIRNSMVDHARRDQREQTQGDLSAEADAVLASASAESYVETTIVMRALMRLPVRWREALWFSEVLKESHEDMAARFGIRTNAVSVLCYRAREGLRQAYLAEHIAHAPSPDCARFSDAIPAYVRSQLPPRKTTHLEAHLEVCAHCTGAVAELTQVNVHLGALVGPAILLAATAHVGLRGWVGAHSGPVKVLLGGAAVSIAAAGAFVSLSGAPERAAPPEPASPPTATTPTPHPAPSSGSSPSPTATPTPTRTPAPTPAPTSARRTAEPSPTPPEPAPLRVSELRTGTARADGTAIAYLSVIASSDDGPLSLVIDLANVTRPRITLGAGDWSCQEAAGRGTAIRLSCVSSGDVRRGAPFGLSADLADARAAVAGSMRMSDAATSRVQPFTIRG